MSSSTISPPPEMLTLPVIAQLMQSMVKSVVLRDLSIMEFPLKSQISLTYVVEFTSSMCTLGGKICPSMVILKGSVNSFGGEEVVVAGAVVLVAAADRAAD